MIATQMRRPGIGPESRALVRELFRPPDRLTLSEWADRYRKLSPESAAEPGTRGVRTARRTCVRSWTCSATHWSAMLSLLYGVSQEATLNRPTFREPQ